MFYHTDAIIEHLSIHRVGNKLQDEFYVLSDHRVDLQDELLAQLLMQYFLNPFAKVAEVYRFFHPNGTLALNELHHFSKEFFQGQLGFHELSQQICKHLFESSNHPKIKGGELYVVHLQGVQLEGEVHEAIGIFKSENKETYLKVYPTEGAFNMDYEQEAININKLDKGCLIVNTESEEGYKVLVVDQTNRQQEAAYWKDDFLKLRVRNDAFHQTGNFLKVYKNFVSEGLDETFEMGRTDKIDLLNRSMDYFKEKETFKQEEFEEEILGNPQAINLFNDYRQQFEKEYDMPIDSNFGISDQAVKKAQSTYKSVLKLDKNFHIYVHGKREYIEKGYDDEKGLNYYKVYFKEEH
ncbi:nucleoid-associated protein [Parapedobacter tibetensis]|uniref:nucleoid-associated protein n=1 Tax=Parapedobacter tibetensis TaxID=2972951 RepID=UPI00214D6AC1|nr:nucleoid-associated protein [Parapedobacter tibetensis]